MCTEEGKEKRQKKPTKYISMYVCVRAVKYNSLAFENKKILYELGNMQEPKADLRLNHKS